MDDFIGKYGQWALMAGSAEGLGEAYSRALARRKMNLVMIDCQHDVLINLSAELEASHGIRTIPLHLDLARDDAENKIMNTIDPLDCRLLIYNAAYSKVQPFLRNSRKDLDNYIFLNTRTPLLLAHAFSEKCKKAGGGGMIFMSSLAGLWGTQLLGPYGATKAFNYILSESLNHELKGYGIDVMSCVAGATATPAYLGTKPIYGWPRPTVMKPEDVAEKALDHLGKKAFYIPGGSNRLTYFLFTRVFPRSWSRRLFNITTGKMYREKL